MINQYFSICGLFCVILLIIAFFGKEKVDSIETRIYGTMIVSSLVDILLVIYEVSFGYMNLSEIPYQLLRISNKIDMVYYILWPTLLFLYMFYITYKDKEKYEKLKKICAIIGIICVGIEICLPINIINNDGAMGVDGIATNFVFGVAVIYFIAILFVIIKNLKSIELKKCIPFVILILFMGLAIYLRNLSPTLIVIPAIMVYIDLIMYFTIENPDVKMLEKVEMARDAAEKANRAKSDFLSSMSHEIRTPLNAIVGLSEDIGSYKDQVPQAVSEDADDIINASQTLLEIVGNILDINKIESNKLEIVDIVYNPKETIDGVAKIDAVRIGDKPIDFKVNIAPDLPYELIGDKVHIKEIVNNLLTNAIKYTEQGEINLNVRCINKGDLSNLIISVQDTGRGIKAENINRLFTKFDRLDVERNTTTEGTGLGLAITKRLVEMMNGTINVQSQFGKGSIFVVNIPQKIKTLTSPTTNSEVEEDVIIDIDNYTNKKILIVDDNTLNIKVARRALQDFNFDIEDVLSGQECLDKVNSGIKYDLILMDIMMPEMSGETTFKKLKEINGFNTPVIALTADAVAGAEEHYKGEGFIDYIAKPFKREQIKEKLDLVFDTKAPINWDEVPVHVIGEEETNETSL